MGAGLHYDEMVVTYFEIIFYIWGHHIIATEINVCLQTWIMQWDSPIRRCWSRPLAEWNPRWLVGGKTIQLETMMTMPTVPMRNWLASWINLFIGPNVQKNGHYCHHNCCRCPAIKRDQAINNTYVDPIVILAPFINVDHLQFQHE